MLGKVEMRPANRPRDGRHCDLCGCSQPAVRCDKCGCQVFCLSCDDMYHRHPKRRFHLRKAVDPAPHSPQARPVLPIKASHLNTAPGDPSKMPLPPPRKKKPGKSFFDSFRRGSPSSDNSPPLPKKEYSWTDRLGSIKKFMSNRPLPPLPNNTGQMDIETPTTNGQPNGRDLSFIHKRVDDRPPQLPERSPRTQDSPGQVQNKDGLPRGPFQAEQIRNGSMEPSQMNRNLGNSLGDEQQWNRNMEQQAMNQQFGTLSRHGPEGFLPQVGPGYPPSGMHQSASATDLHNLDTMPQPPGMPPYPHYPMQPHMHYPYPMYPQYPGYFGNSFANLNHPPTSTDGDFSDHSESSVPHHPSGKRQPFRKRAKRSQSVMMDRMAYPGQFFPFGPFHPGYPAPPWAPPMPMEPPPSPGGSIRSLHRRGRRKKVTSEEDEEFSMSSSPLSRPKSSSSDRPPRGPRKAPLATQTTSSEEESDEEETNRNTIEKLPRRNSDTRKIASPVAKSPLVEGRRTPKQKKDTSKHSESEDQDTGQIKGDRKSSRDSNADFSEPAQSVSVAAITTANTVKEWQCKHCTFINPTSNRICQVCCKTATPPDSRPPSGAAGSRKQSLSSEQGCSSPEKKVEEEEDQQTKQNKQDMAILNSALDEAEKEISRGLEELMKLKDDITTETSTIDKNKDSKTQSSSSVSKPVYKSTGKMRTSILEKLNLNKQATASTSTSTDTQTDTRQDKILQARRMSNSSSASEKFNSPLAQSPDLRRCSEDDTRLKKDSSCQTLQDSLFEYLERKKAEEDAILGRVGGNLGSGYAERFDAMASPVPSMYDRFLGGGFGPMQRSHSRASLFTGRLNDLGPAEYGGPGVGYGPASMYRSASRSSLTGDFGDARLSEFAHLRKPDFYLSMEELVERRRQENLRAQGLELVRMIREAEQQGFTADDIQVALSNCGQQSPVEWLMEHWRNTIECVMSLATRYGEGKGHNDVGAVSEVEAREALRLHKANVWAAVTECVEGRQRKFLELSARGKFDRKDIVDALTSSKGDVEMAYAKLTKSTGKPFLMRIWGAGEGVQNQDGAMPLDEDFRPLGVYPRFSKDAPEELLSDEHWTEDEEDVEWDDEEDEDEGDLEDLQTCHENLLSQDMKTPESDKSDYCDPFPADDKKSVNSDDIFFVIPDQKEPKKKGTGLLSKLAALRKDGKDAGQQSSRDGEPTVSSAEDIEAGSEVSSSGSGHSKSYGPLNLIKNTISAIKDTVIGASEKKLPCSAPERRTIIVKGQISHESLETNDQSVKLSSVKPIDDSSSVKPLAEPPLMKITDDLPLMKSAAAEDSPYGKMADAITTEIPTNEKISTSSASDATPVTPIKDKKVGKSTTENTSSLTAEDKTSVKPVDEMATMKSIVGSTSTKSDCDMTPTELAIKTSSVVTKNNATPVKSVEETLKQEVVSVKQVKGVLPADTTLEKNEKNGISGNLKYLKNENDLVAYKEVNKSQITESTGRKETGILKENQKVNKSVENATRGDEQAVTVDKYQNTKNDSPKQSATRTSDQTSNTAGSSIKTDVTKHELEQIDSRSERQLDMESKNQTKQEGNELSNIGLATHKTQICNKVKNEITESIDSLQNTQEDLSSLPVTDCRQKSPDNNVTVKETVESKEEIVLSRKIIEKDLFSKDRDIDNRHKIKIAAETSIQNKEIIENEKVKSQPQSANSNDSPFETAEQTSNNQSNTSETTHSGDINYYLQSTSGNSEVLSINLALDDNAFEKQPQTSETVQSEKCSNISLSDSKSNSNTEKSSLDNKNELEDLKSVSHVKESNAISLESVFQGDKNDAKNTDISLVKETDMEDREILLRSIEKNDKSIETIQSKDLCQSVVENDILPSEAIGSGSGYIQKDKVIEDSHSVTSEITQEVVPNQTEHTIPDLSVNQNPSPFAGTSIQNELNKTNEESEDKGTYEIQDPEVNLNSKQGANEASTENEIDHPAAKYSGEFSHDASKDNGIASAVEEAIINKSSAEASSAEVKSIESTVLPIKPDLDKSQLLAEDNISNLTAVEETSPKPINPIRDTQLPDHSRIELNNSSYLPDQLSTSKQQMEEEMPVESVSISRIFPGSKALKMNSTSAKFSKNSNTSANTSSKPSTSTQNKFTVGENSKTNNSPLISSTSRLDNIHVKIKNSTVVSRERDKIAKSDTIKTESNDTLSKEVTSQEENSMVSETSVPIITNGEVGNQEPKTESATSENSQHNALEPKVEAIQSFDLSEANGESAAESSVEAMQSSSERHSSIQSISTVLPSSSNLQKVAELPGPTTIQSTSSTEFAQHSKSEIEEGDEETSSASRLGDIVPPSPSLQRVTESTAASNAQEMTTSTGLKETAQDSESNEDEEEDFSFESRPSSITPPSPVDALRSRFEGLMGVSASHIGPVRPQSPFRRMSFNSRKEAIALERKKDTILDHKSTLQPKVNKEPTKPLHQKRSIKQQLEMERKVRRMVADRKCATYRKAEIVIQLMEMDFSEEEALQAAGECSTLEKAISYLRQECLLCAGHFAVSEIVSMIHCSHKACRQCIRAYFTVQIRDRTIMELQCPFCNEPDITDDDVAQDYFNHLDIMLKKLVEPEIHELFQRKLRDRVLMKDPNFRWCSQCSSGFIAMPNLKLLVCPDCNAVSCASCRRPWEKEHQGITCEAFAVWKDATDPEAQTAGLAKLLTEDGIDCPNCHFRYALAKGGCMHFRCIQCQHDFCSGCSRPFKMGQKCGVSEFCAKLGLHAHHPRNCLFYLRDKEPEDLQRLLQMSGVDYNSDAPDDGDGTCQVMEQKETKDGMLDDHCGKPVEEGFAGLCRVHYVEYLGQLVNKHKVDPIQIFDNDDLELVLRRANIRLPPKRYRESEVQYREKLVKLIQEELPLDKMDGS